MMRPIPTEATSGATGPRPSRREKMASSRTIPKAARARNEAIAPQMRETPFSVRTRAMYAPRVIVSPYAKLANPRIPYRIVRPIAATITMLLMTIPPRAYLRMIVPNTNASPARTAMTMTATMPVWRSSRRTRRVGRNAAHLERTRSLADDSDPETSAMVQSRTRGRSGTSLTFCGTGGKSYNPRHDRVDATSGANHRPEGCRDAGLELRPQGGRFRRRGWSRVRRVDPRPRAGGRPGRPSRDLRHASGLSGRGSRERLERRIRRTRRVQARRSAVGNRGTRSRRMCLGHPGSLGGDRDGEGRTETVRPPCIVLAEHGAGEPHRRRVASGAVRRDSNGGNYRTRDHRRRGWDPPVLRTARAHGVSVVRAESARHLLISGVVWPPGHGLRSHDVRHHDVRRDLRDRQPDRRDDVLRRPDAGLPEDDEDAGDPEGRPRGDDRAPRLRARRELHLPPVRHIDPGVPRRGRDPPVLDRVLDDAGRAVADAAHAPGPPGGARARGGRRGAPGHPDARRSRRDHDRHGPHGGRVVTRVGHVADRHHPGHDHRDDGGELAHAHVRRPYLPPHRPDGGVRDLEDHGPHPRRDRGAVHHPRRARRLPGVLQADPLS